MSKEVQPEKSKNIKTETFLLNTTTKMVTYKVNIRLFMQMATSLLSASMKMDFERENIPNFSKTKIFSSKKNIRMENYMGLKKSSSEKTF